MKSLLRRAFPDEEGKSDVVLVVARPGGPLAAADYAVADRLARSSPAGKERAGPDR